MKTILQRASLAVVLVVAFASVARADEPALPAGLGGGGDSASEPALPAGLGGGTSASSSPGGEPRVAWPINLSGSGEIRAGRRVRSDPYEEDESLGEARIQIEADGRAGGALLKVTGDLLFDAVADERDADIRTGEGWFDLRELHASFSPLAAVDVKAGRQILTWGTGDLVFINDNFPKDWVSFLLGRDVEYLKAPSDAVKVSVFGAWADLDVVYTPQFDPDRYISGQRVSYFNGSLGARAGENAVVRTDRPDTWFADDEWAARLYRNVRGYELALYAYSGFWKSPAGQSPAGRAVFPPLDVYGASVRGKCGRGIGNIEVGYFDSRDDRAGDDPLVRNSEWRLLTGYEQDLSMLAPDFTLGLQYYVEWMNAYGPYERSLPEGAVARDEVRHVVTVRLTKLLMQQNLELSLFTFYSPSGRDAYVRPRATYKVTDRWRIEAGGNVFVASAPHTFFGQFEQNSNVYGGIRYSF